MPYRSVGVKQEAAIPKDTAAKNTAGGDTRAELLDAAKRLFGERGFYGASIAQIAAELGLTKQALIHHFGTKERLYGEVLSQMATRVSGVVSRARSTESDPVKALEDVFLRLYANVFGQPDDTQLLMRELIDNRARAGQAHSWPMREFLDAIVGMVGKTPRGAALSRVEALARVYLLIGGINYVAVSEPTLTSMYDDAFDELQTQFPREVRRMVREAFA